MKLAISNFHLGENITTSPRVTTEFAVHFVKHHKKNRNLFTIGVWEKRELRAICHVAPLNSALAAVRREMENAGIPLASAPVNTVGWRSLFVKSKVIVLKLASTLLGGAPTQPPA